MQRNSASVNVGTIGHIDYQKSSIVRFCDEAEKKIQLNDFALDLPTKRKFKDNGAMIAPATIARTGIMQYTAGQCGALFADRDPNSIVKIMTLEADLFDEESLNSYHSAPITIGHPEEDVTTANARELQKGHLDGVPFADKESGMLAANIVLSDAEAISTVENGMSQLSSGHTCVLVMADEGEEYDAKKTMIRANHVAIVAVGRAGSAEIADEALGVPTPTLEELAIKHNVEIEKLKDALEKGIEVEKEHTEDVKVAEEIALDHLSESPDYYEELEELEEELKLGDAITLIEKLNAELDSAKEMVQSTKQKLKDEEAKFRDTVNSLVKSKLEFLSIASKLTDVDLIEVSEHDAKVLILKDTLGKDFSEKTEAYVEARFDGFLDNLEANEKEEGRSIAAVLADDAKNQANLVDTVMPAKNQTAREKMIARNKNIK